MAAIGAAHLLQHNTHPICPSMTHSIETRGGLPTEMQTLLRDYPRDTWPGHPNFAASIGNWMGAHRMFRTLAKAVRDDTEDHIDGKLGDASYLAGLSRAGGALVSNLHGHHAWEDRRFFPELAGADDRFTTGLDMLEADHLEMDALLGRFTRKANRAIQLEHLDPAQVGEEVKGLHGETEALVSFLDRHLSDEEDLVVPILLHHKLRG